MCPETVKLLNHHIKYKITTSLSTQNSTQLLISIPSLQKVLKKTQVRDWVRVRIELAQSGKKYRLQHETIRLQILALRESGKS